MQYNWNTQVGVPPFPFPSHYAFTTVFVTLYCINRFCFHLPQMWADTLMRVYFLASPRYCQELYLALISQYHLEYLGHLEYFLEVIFFINVKGMIQFLRIEISQTVFL